MQESLRTTPEDRDFHLKLTCFNTDDQHHVFGPTLTEEQQRLLQPRRTVPQTYPELPEELKELRAVCRLLVMGADSQRWRMPCEESDNRQRLVTTECEERSRLCLVYHEIATQEAKETAERRATHETLSDLQKTIAEIAQRVQDISDMWRKYYEGDRSGMQSLEDTVAQVNDRVGTSRRLADAIYRSASRTDTRLQELIEVPTQVKIHLERLTSEVTEEFTKLLDTQLARWTQALETYIVRCTTLQDELKKRVDHLLVLQHKLVEEFERREDKWAKCER